MTTLIIQGGTRTTRQAYLTPRLAGSELIHLCAEKSTITIQQVHSLNLPLSLTPRLPRIVWIEEANFLTVPAQNALLKMLEEPPVATTFYLTLRHKSSLLSTILSRALTLTLDQDQPHDDPTVLGELKTIMQMSPGDRLAKIPKLDREATKLWLTQIEGSLQAKLKEPNLTAPHAQLLAKLASLTLSAHSQLVANCNLSLVIQNYYLLLPHTHSTR